MMQHSAQSLRATVIVFVALAALTPGCGSSGSTMDASTDGSCPNPFGCDPNCAGLASTGRCSTPGVICSEEFDYVCGDDHIWWCSFGSLCHKINCGDPPFHVDCSQYSYTCEKDHRWHCSAECCRVPDLAVAEPGDMTAQGDMVRCNDGDCFRDASR
jgi:hypothetical protein